jgi:hypothetical protein
MVGISKVFNNFFGVGNIHNSFNVAVQGREIVSADAHDELTNQLF